MSARRFKHLFALVIATCIAARPIGATTLFALVSTGELFASTNVGASWALLATIPAGDAAGIVAGSSSLKLFLATRSGVVYRSRNAGHDWTAVGSITASDVVDIAVRSDGALLLLTRTGLVWQSRDDGATFTTLAALTRSSCVSLLAGSGTSLYVLTRDGEVAETTNNGANWTRKSVINVPDAVAIRRLNAEFYVLTSTGFVFRSQDTATSWLPVGSISQAGMNGFSQAANGLVAASRDGLVARSPNGQRWTWVGAINQLRVLALGNDNATGRAVGVELTTWSAAKQRYRR